MTTYPTQTTSQLDKTLCLPVTELVNPEANKGLQPLDSKSPLSLIAPCL